jgi:hypothetical protein
MTDRFNRTDLSPQALKAWQIAHPELDPDRDQPTPKYHINHDYDNKDNPMTPQTPTQPEKITAAELRAELAAIRQDVNLIKDTIATLAHGILTAGSQAQQVQTGTITDMIADCIVMTYTDAGEPAYKLTGTPYNKFGVRVWPEVLDTLPHTDLKPGKNPIPPLKVRVLMATNDAGKSTPRKVIGKG